MEKKVWLATVSIGNDDPVLRNLFASVGARLAAGAPPGIITTSFVPAETPADADIVLFLETNQYKKRSHVFRILRHELFRKFPDRCFAYDFQDEPPGILPGVYVSLSRRWQNPNRFRAGGYLEMYNRYTMQFADYARETEPDLLFSFRGSAKPNRVRSALFEANFSGPDIAMTRTDRWFDYSGDEKELYVQEICRSRFVLCPRGVATSSYRMYETMALGRVPVVISDDWESPPGIDWDSIILRVPENDIADIPDILRAREGEWRERGERGRAVWEQFFHPDVALFRTLEAIVELANLRASDPAVRAEETAARREWLSYRFARENGWTVPQQAYRTYRISGMRDRVHAKLPFLFHP